MPTVDVLIPSYNYGRYLRECAQSVLSQPDVDVNLLIIDDCSTDNTPEVCRELTQSDSRVRIIRHETNKGHIATYNEGISLARAKYFTLVSADDLMTPGALSRATRIMEHDEAIGLVYGYSIPFTGNILPAARTTATKSTTWSGHEWIKLMCESGKNFIRSPETLVRTAVQLRIGGYAPSLPQTGDMEMWLRFAAVSDVGYVNGADQAYYRLHSMSMQHTVHSGFFLDLEARRKAFQSAFEKEASRIPDAEALHTIAKRTLALTAVRRACHICECRREGSDPIEKYIDFAIVLYPDIVATREWQTLQRHKRERRTLQRTVARGRALVREVIVREILNRVERHHAKRTGVFLARKVEF